jgi:ribokinase
VVAVIGSYNVGLTFQTPRLPVWGETVLGGTFTTGPGGKGSNQAIGAARLGAEVRFVGCIGPDAYGDEAIALWRTERVDAQFVRRGTLATGAGVILLNDDGNNAIVVAPGANTELTPADVSSARGAFAGANVVLAQLESPLPAVLQAARLARLAGASFVLNPAPARELTDDLLALVDVLTPNETELAILSGVAPDQRYRPRDAAKNLLDRGAGAVVLTRGARGATVITGEAALDVPAPRVRVVDTTGAGDAFTAALGVALAEGQELVAAASFACQAGALAVTRAEVIPALPTRAAIDALRAAPSTQAR